MHASRVTFHEIQRFLQRVATKVRRSNTSCSEMDRKKSNETQDTATNAFLVTYTLVYLSLQTFSYRHLDARSQTVPESFTMFEARLMQGSLLKKIIEAIKDLVTDANFDCTENDFSLQAMDSSHVSLVAMTLEKDGFEHFRCDKAVSMGMHLIFIPCGWFSRCSLLLVEWPLRSKTCVCRYQSRANVEDSQVRWK